MKKLLITVLALATAFTAFAQGEQKVDLGLNVGAGFISAQQKGSTTFNGQKFESNSDGLGYYLNIGADGDLGLAGLGYAMDLFFDHWKLWPEDGDNNSYTTENYLGYALQLNFPINTSESVCLRPFFGPGFAYGLSSKSHAEGDVAGQHFEEDTNNYEKNSGYSRSYAYITLGADVLLKPANLRIRGGVDFGMWDRATAKESKVKDGPNFRLGVAYLF
ncbi:MAG: outer membrane beta-barrel protein [Bacteroidales bacterium]|nr:outer membrane beta-barrel protein [Bacteroidales bacterium]